MTLRLVGTWFGTLASMVLFASPAVAVTDGTCHAQTRKAREQCRSVLSALLPAVVIDDVRRQSSLSERLRRYQVPGISMAFIDSGHVSWLAVHGQRERNGEPINPQTVFQAASISKPVAATLALLVVGSGDLRLNTPVNAQLHSWQLPASDQLQPTGVTLRRLLSHRAGINVHEFPGYAADAPLPDEIQILDGQAPANSPPVRLLLQPGSAYRYSGGGYQIAQLLIEDAVGKPFGQVAQERLFGPLGMQRTAYSAELPGRLAGNVAKGHTYSGKAVAGGWHRYPELAAAALWSTPSDLARYFMAVMAGADGGTGSTLTPAIAQMMQTPVAEGMSMGFGVHREGTDRLIDQSGANAGYQVYMAGYPKRGQGVIIMTNGDGGKDLIGEICRSLALVYGWPDFASQHADLAKVASTTLDQRSGDYSVRKHGFTLSLRRSGKTLIGTTPRGSSYTFLPLSPWKFIAQEDAAELVFEPEHPGRLHVWGMHAERVGQP